MGNLFQPRYIDDSKPLPAAANQTLFLKLADDAAGCFGRRACHLGQVIPGKGHLYEHTLACNFSNFIGQLEKVGGDTPLYGLGTEPPDGFLGFQQPFGCDV
jgi:hypothetical protein